MQAVVKKPPIRVTGQSIPNDLLSFLKSSYGEVEVIADDDDELVDVTTTAWYKNIKSKTTPGEVVKIYRELHKMTQEELGHRLGKFTRQHVSAMETGHRGISKATAKKLAKIFTIDVSRLL